MKKLRLDLNKLQVDSFQLSEKELAERGTVHGNATRFCTAWASCQGSCPGTCQADSCYDCTHETGCQSYDPTCYELTCDGNC
jgi:hypothetical protein